METGDASYIKQLNRKILLEEIIKNKLLSRSDLARITGLNKATVSAQVNRFIQENLVVETEGNESTNRGRRPIMLEINGDAGYSIGVDIDATHISFLFMTLNGRTIDTLHTKIAFEDISQLTAQLIETLTPLINKYNQSYQPLGLVGISIGIHGIVNNKQEIIFTPKEEWSNINIKSKLEEAFHTSVYIDNNANLSVFAEQVFDEHIPDLFCITLYSGIGLGIINNNRIYRGYQGFAGEIGHMIVESHGLECPCGNKGCWELYASERALISILEENNIPLQDAFDKKNLKSCDIINQYIEYLEIGLNNVINIFNPEKVVLNGSLINGNSPFITDITSKLKSKMNNYREIRASKLGEKSCTLGGAALALKNFFEIDSIDFTGYNYIQHLSQSQDS
ncbi:ROK family transcriptional regulator [Oceanobacillus piezotolerans]|uniref:ROK family transcriptional regulator n=1 Tax=Oceanobacillus piezotolerans TaxID=2448030 RepID=A0A498D691_9BACI|nr:ROK family transcriptional regulator [Oceanobacillus piezotolerans]RLL40712.1 ROK family transcriptional regulator [Oceanobacillus piezotolerans]